MRPAPSVFPVILAAIFCYARAAAEEPWPADDRDLVFAQRSAHEAPMAYGEDGEPLYGVSLKPKGLARSDSHGRMLVSGGWYFSDRVGERFAAAIADSEAFTLELTVAPSLDRRPGARLVALTQSDGTVGLALDQNGLELSLSIAESSERGRPAQVLLFSVEPGKPNHVAITYTGGRLKGYLNGRLAAESEIHLNLENGEAWTLTLGAGPDGSGDWAGAIEGVALYSRALSRDEVAKQESAYRTILARRVPAERLRIRGRLLAKSDVPEIDDLAPYTQSLSVYIYAVEKIFEGDYAEEKIHVAHWCVLDSKRLPTKDLAIDRSYMLTLEAFDANKQLETENLSDNVVDDFSLPYFYSVELTTLQDAASAGRP